MVQCDVSRKVMCVLIRSVDLMLAVGTLPSNQTRAIMPVCLATRRPSSCVKMFQSNFLSDVQFVRDENYSDEFKFRSTVDTSLSIKSDDDGQHSKTTNKCLKLR